ncbi:MAG: alanine racemase [Devosia sp. 67-54]|uniref:D-TA family PLP-dependent enzyme n=1 Tax=unclassified Devosia TaxID=196773 RepID=UPI00086E22A9|nr:MULTISPECIES: D-TA family PLP-dependent enzyme [unclassified Devosia]MBN9305009.1 D-TA family PLP-dependent enzyme [Devosia sp.]ODU56126.1 MAG: alanine racemase [Acetobacteraceae bacterium SCN 69-10]OJX15046.1 MAG: alanine racemase [Devosia sp. 67-54]
MTRIDDLETPCVVIDLGRVEANLQRAQAHADANGYALRPHIKTHKLPRFAKRALALGAVGITVQKLGEAEVMADAGLTDIFLPYNLIGDKKLSRLKALNERIRISVTADSPETVAGYAAAFAAPGTKPLTVLIECDTGGGRCGVQSPAQALALARQIALAPGLRFGGLMTYPPRGQAAAADRWLGEAKTLLETAGIDVPVVTSGNSPDMWHTGDSVVTERRPGTYIYFDRSQVGFGAARFADCALTVLTTVVSRPTPTRIVVDAGSKALSSDLLGQTGHGAVQGHEEIVVTALSEEHGVIELDAPSDWPRVGERLRLIPNHACVVSNLFDRVNLLAADGTIEAVPVAARGRVD